MLTIVWKKGYVLLCKSTDFQFLYATYDSIRDASRIYKIFFEKEISNSPFSLLRKSKEHMNRFILIIKDKFYHLVFFLVPDTRQITHMYRKRPLTGYEIKKDQ
jgi:hypothetical protein